MPVEIDGAAKHYPKPDNKYTFDKLNSVFLSGNATRDDAPNHIRIQERVPREIAQTWVSMCPAQVYEIPEEQLENGAAVVEVQVTPSNCVQCGAITAKGGRLTLPEGGDGPLYQGDLGDVPVRGGQHPWQPLDLDQAAFDRVANQLRAGAEAKLLLDVARWDSTVRTQVELLGDLVVGVAEGDQAQHLGLTVAEVIPGRQRRAPRRAARPARAVGRSVPRRPSAPPSQAPRSLPP